MGKRFAMLLLVALGVAGVMAVAGDFGGEVVVLTTSGAGGNPHETTLWVVDDHGQVWLRAGNPGADWFQRLKARPSVTLERGGKKTAYRAVVMPQQRERINRSMAERYGLANWLIGLAEDLGQSQPIRLDPVEN